MNPTYPVVIANVARQDLRHLRSYLLTTAGSSADKVVARLMGKIESLSAFPERGPIPDEFRDLHVKQYRQTTLPPYRIVYKLEASKVTVLVVADGRRDFEKLLRDRLLR